MPKMTRVIVATLSAALAVIPASAQSSQELMELTELADVLAFDIAQNREIMLERCSASEWCRVYGQELIDAIEAGGNQLRLGPIAVPAIDEMLGFMDAPAKAELFAFYRSAVGRRIVELEKESRTQAFLKQVDERGAEYYASIADIETRYAQIEAIDSVADLSPTQRAQDRTAQSVVDWLADRAKKNEETPQPVQLETRARDRHAFHLRLALTYETMPDDEVEQYVEFLQSEGAEQWSQTLREIRRRSAEEAVKPIMSRLIARLGS